MSLVLAGHAAESNLTKAATPAQSFTNYSTDLSSSYGLGWWIWADQTFDQQTCRFWRAFEIARSESVTYARIRMTADNSYRLFLDGREIGKGGEWRCLNEYNVTPLLEPGLHELAIEVFSDYGPAGMIFGLRIELSNGRVIDVFSDEKWKIIPAEQKNSDTPGHDTASWSKAKVIAPFGEGSWRQASARILQGPPLHPIIVRFWQTAWFQITLLSICSIAILVSVCLMSQLSSQTKAQAFLRRERARIARDIHDDVGARLSHLVLLGERAQRNDSSDGQTRAQFDQICERMREVLSAIDEVVWCVNSRRDTVRDFETCVCNYAETFLQSTNIRCRSGHFLDGITNGTGTLVTTMGDTGEGVGIGTRGDGVTRMKGDVAEFLIFGAALSDADRAALDAHFGTLYGVSVGVLPKLTVGAGAGSVSLSSPNTAGFGLKSSPTVGRTWTPITTGIVTTNGANFISILTTENQQFYKLRKPIKEFVYENNFCDLLAYDQA